MHRVVRSLAVALVTLALIVPQAAQAAAGTLTPAIKIQIPGFPLNLADPRGTGLSTDFIRFDPATNLIYLTDGANKAVDVFSATTRSMVDRITLPDAPHDAIVDDSLHLLITPLSNKTVVITSLTNGTQQTITVGGTSIADLAGYDPSTKTLVVGSKGTSQLSFIHVDPTTSTLLGQLPLTASPEEPVFFNGKFYLSVPNNVSIVDPTTRTIVGNISVPGCSGHGFAHGPGSEFYLGCTSGGVILDLSAGTVVTQFPSSQISDTDQPAYDAKNNRYYAPGHITVNGASVAVMAVIDATSHQLLATLNIDPGSETQTAADATGTTWVATGPQVGGQCLSTCLFGYQPSASAGRDLKVTSNGLGSVTVSWNAGLGQSSLALIRIAGGTRTILPTPPAGSTSATDQLPAGTNLACYQLLAFSATSVMVGQSDTECVVTNVAAPIPSAAPMPVSISLSQGSTATVSWGAAPGATGYMLMELREGRTQFLSSTQLSASDTIVDPWDCYLVVGRGPTGAPTSVSDGVCAVPGNAGGATAQSAH